MFPSPSTAIVRSSLSFLGAAKATLAKEDGVLEHSGGAKGMETPPVIPSFGDGETGNHLDEGAFSPDEPAEDDSAVTPVRESEKETVSQAGLMDTLRTLFGDLHVSQQQELRRLIEVPPALSALSADFRRGTEAGGVSSRVRSGRPRSHTLSPGELFARRLHREEEGEVRASERADFEFAKSLAQEDEGVIDSEGDESARGYDVGTDVAFPKVPAFPTVSASSRYDPANRFAALSLDKADFYSDFSVNQDGAASPARKMSPAEELLDDASVAAALAKEAHTRAQVAMD